MLFVEHVMPCEQQNGGKSLNLIVRRAEPQGEMSAGRNNRQDMKPASGWSSALNVSRL